MLYGKNMKNKKFTGIYLPVDLVNDFQSRFPRLFTVFVQRCMIKSLQDREFFNDVYFCTEDPYSGLGANNPYNLRNKK